MIYIDVDGNLLFDRVFDWGGILRDHSTEVRIGDQSYLLSSETGVLTPVPAEWSISSFFQERANITVNDKYGFISTGGEIVIPPIYDDASDFNLGSAFVRREKELLRIDRDGNILESYGNYCLISRDPQGMRNVYTEKKPCRGFKYFIADEHMENRIGPFTDADALWDGMQWVLSWETKREFYLDATGQSAFEKSENIAYLSRLCACGRILFTDNKRGLTGYLDKKGRVAIPARYAEADSFSENRAVFHASRQKKALKGLIDEYGHEIIPPMYDTLSSMLEGKIAAEKQGAWGFLDASGQEVIPFRYKLASDFHHGIGRVWLE